MKFAEERWTGPRRRISSPNRSADKERRRRSQLARRRLWLESLEERSVLATIDLVVNLYQDNAGVPGALINTNSVTAGQNFFVEITAKDTSAAPSGIIGLALDVGFSAANFDEIDAPFDPANPASPIITADFPLSRTGTLDNTTGTIDELSGVSLPNLNIGKAIGVATHERFALLKFKAETAVANSPFNITIGKGSVAFADGSSLTAGSTIEAQTITVEPNVGPVPTLTIDDITADEGSDGTTTNFTFTVTLTPASALPVLVQVDTANGTATAPADYGSVLGTVLNFAAGETTKTVTVKVVADKILEPVENFFVNLSKADGAVIGDGQGIGTITNDDTITASITKTVTQGEGNAGTTNFDFTVTLDQTAATEVTIPWSFANVGTTDADFGAGLTKSGKVTIPTGQLSAKITPSFPVNGDNTVELDETFTVTLGTPETAGVVLSADKVGTGTITNDDSATIVITGPIAAAEGNAGNTAREFTVSLSNPVDVPVSINFQTQDGTATTAGNDYVPVNGQLTFNAGSTTAQKISVDVVGDTTVETDEQFGVLINGLNAGAPARNVTIQTSTASATIQNDDSATVTIQSVSIVEGNAGTQNLKFSVKLSNPVAGEVSVDLATQDVTALAGTDYTATNKTITFPADSTAAIDFLVPISGDNVVELDETFSVLLSNLKANGLNVTLPAGPPVTGTITNDDAATITLDSKSQFEGNAGTQNMVFTATLSNPVDIDVTVDFNTADSTATTADNDYTATTQKLTFTKGGPLTQTINVPIVGDTNVENDETFNVTLSNLQASGRNVTLGAAQTGTILDDDSNIPTASVSDVTLVEGNAGTTAFVFTITLDKANPLADVVLQVSTTDVTTIAGQDYTQLINQAVTIPLGKTSATVTVQVTGETLIETDETFKLSITKIDGAKIGDGEGLGTITNDDFTNVSINSVTLAEGNAGTTNFDFTVALDTAAEFDAVIPWTFTHVDSNDADFTAGFAKTGKVTVLKGSKNATISFPVSGDTKLEANEKFNVTLGTPENAAVKLSANVVGVGTINNDDQVIVSIDDLTQNEPPFGSTKSYDFTVSLDQAADIDVVVPWTFANVTTANADFNPAPTVSGKVTIAKGSTSAKVTPSFVAAPDLLTEANETFTVTLGTPETAGAVLTQTAADQIGTGTIVDTPAPVASIDSVTLAEGNAGSTTFNFTVTLDQVSPVEVVIPWTLANVTSKDNDFAGGQAKTGKVTIAANSKTATIPIAVNGDTTLEAGDTFTVTLGAPESANAVLDGAKSAGTGTITNDDQVSVTINDVTGTEPANGNTKDFVFTATLAAAAEVDVVVPWTFANVTTSDADFGAGLTKTGKVTIPAGSTSAPLTPAFPVAGDLINENQETFTVTLDTPETVGAVLGAAKVGTGTINDVGTIIASIGDKTLAEGNAGSTSFEFTVTLDAAAAGDVVIPWTLANGTSTDADFAAGQAKTGKVTVLAGQTTAKIPIAVNGDTTLEADDTFTVTLGTPETANVVLDNNAKIGDGTITNDDQVTATIDSKSQNEGNAGTTNYEFTVTLDKAADIDVVIPWTFAHVTTNKGDFGGVEPTATAKVTIPAGQTSAKLPAFGVSGDTVLEATETFTVTLGTPETAGAVLGANKTATGTLVNDDAVNVTIASFSKLEGNAGTTDFDFTVTLDQAAAIDVVVPWAFAHVTTNKDDFGGTEPPTTGKVTIPAGQLTAKIEFDVSGDTLNENDETFTVTLQTPETAGAALGAGKVGTATVQNDDVVTATIDSKTLAEGNTGTTSFVFTVTLDKAAAGEVIIPFTLANGTAKDSDFAAGQAKTGKVTIAAGQTTKTITIDVSGDTTLEGDDTFTVTLGTPETTNAVLGAAKIGTGTITNDDQATVTIANVTQTEGNAGTKNFDFTVSLDKAAEIDVVVPWTFAHVTSNNADFGGASPTTTGKVTIPAGSTTATITGFAVSGDTLLEANDTFTVTLGTPETTGAVLGTAKVGTGTITNDDQVTVTINSFSKQEGNAGTTAFDFTVTIDQTADIDVVVPFTFANVTTADDDFAAGLTKSGKVTIPAGSKTKTLSFSVNGDTTIENDETFTVTLGTPETSGAVLGTDKIGTATVQNDDTATASIANVTQNEGNSGTTNFDFTVTLDKAAAFDVTIPWTFANVTSTDGDFGAGLTKTGNVTIPAGQLSAKITPSFPVNGDTTVEANETFTVTLGTPNKTGVVLSDSAKVATGTITNDDSATLTITNAKQFEPGTGTNKITFDVTLSQPVDVDTTVTYNFANVTTSDADFANLTKTGTLTFKAGSKTPETPLAFDVAADAISEPDETFTITLATPTFTGGVTRNVTVAGSPATGTIQQDPATGKLSGFAYVDSNNNGVKDANEPGIPGVTVTLTGTPTNGNAITLTAMTANDGSYAFTNLGGGKYEIAQTQPPTMFDGIDTVGTQGGTLANDKISAITLDPAEEGTGNNFGELGLLPQFVTKRLFLSSTPAPAQTLRMLNGRAAEIAGNQTLANQIFNATVPSVVAAPALNAPANNNGAAPEFIPDSAGESAGEFIPEETTSAAAPQTQIAPPSPAPASTTPTTAQPPVTTSANGSLYGAKSAATTKTVAKSTPAKTTLAKSTPAKTTVVKTATPKVAAAKPVAQTTAQTPAVSAPASTSRSVVRALTSSAAAASSAPPLSTLELLALDELLAREKKWR